MSYLIESENDAINFLNLFEACNDFKSLFSFYSKFVINLQIPSFNDNINLTFKELDYNANCLLLNYSKYVKNYSYLAYKSSADGSCFFHSLSLSLYGSEQYSFRLRLFILNYVMKNYEVLQRTNPVSTYPTLSSLLGMSLEDSILRMSKTKGYSCRLTAFCASRALAINIHLIFPPVYGLTSPYSRYPNYFENSLSRRNPRLVTIVWTTASNIIQPNKSEYNFNHFCPVFNGRDNFCTIPDSHFEKVNSLNDHFFHPFKNTNHPCSFESLENLKLKCSLVPVSKENKKSSFIKAFNVLDTINVKFDSQNFSNNHTEKIQPNIINDIKSNNSYTNNLVNIDNSYINKNNPTKKLIKISSYKNDSINVINCSKPFNIAGIKLNKNKFTKNFCNSNAELSIKNNTNNNHSNNLVTVVNTDSKYSTKNLINNSKNVMPNSNLFFPVFYNDSFSFEDNLFSSKLSITKAAEVINSYKGKPYVFDNFPNSNCYFLTCQEVVNGLKDKCFLKLKYRSHKHNFFRNKTSTGDIIFSKKSTSASSVSIKVAEHNYISKCQYNNYKNKTKNSLTFQKTIFTFENILLIQYIGSPISNCECTITKSNKNDFKNFLVNNVHTPKNDLYYKSLDKFVTKKNMYYHINKTKKELGITNRSVDRNVVQEICDLSKKAGKDIYIRRYILNKSNSELPSFVLYLKDSLYDLFSLITNSNYKCLIQIDKTFDRSEFYITSLTYKNTKLYRRNSKDHASFIGPIFLHASSKTEVFIDFFKTLDKGLQEIADETFYLKDWRSKLIFVSDQEFSLTKALDTVFPGSTRILCSRHILGNLKANIDNDLLKQKFKSLIYNCNSFTKYNEIKNNILSSTQFSSCNLKKKRYINKSLHLIFRYVLQPYIYLNLDKPVLNNLAENTNHCIKSAIKETVSPKIIVQQLKQLLIVQFSDIKKSITKKSTFTIPGYTFFNCNLDENSINEIYKDFLTNNNVNNHDYCILGKRSRKAYSNETKNVLIKDNEHFQHCDTGPDCHCFNFKKLKLKLKPGARRPYSKTQSPHKSKYNFKSKTPPRLISNGFNFKNKEV